MTVLSRLFGLFQRFTRSAHGSVSVEAAFGLVFFIVILYAVADYHAVSQIRDEVEDAAGSISLNLSTQEKLTQQGFDALVTGALQNKTRDTDVVALNVLQSGKIQWMLERGDEAQLCQVDVDGRYFTGDLPEDPPEDSENNGENGTDMSELSMVVVYVCRSTNSLRRVGKFVFPNPIEVQNINRAMKKTIEIDEALKKENMVKSDDEDENQSEVAP